MRTSFALITVLSLVPASALADDDAMQPKVVVAPDPHSDGSGGYIAPTTAPYEGGDIPKNAKLVTQPNYTLLATGVGIFTASYGGALIYGLATCPPQQDCRQGSGWLYIPFIGPFITAAVNETPSVGGRALAALDGTMQLFGATLAVASFVWRKKLVMWQSKTASLQLTPTGGAVAGAPSMGGNMGERPAISGGVAVTLTNL